VTTSLACEQARGGVCIAHKLPLIFFTTMEDAGALVIRSAAFDDIEHGDVIDIRPVRKAKF